MVQPAVYADAEADARLAALGLTQDVLATALQQADAEAAQTTDLDPPTAEGLVRYIATVR